MSKLTALLRFLRNRSGATIIEYCMIAGIISVVVVGGATTIGTKTNTSFNAVQAGFTGSP